MTREWLYRLTLGMVMLLFLHRVYGDTVVNPGAWKGVYVEHVAAAPSGACTGNRVEIVRGTGATYDCADSNADGTKDTWAARITGGGSCSATGTNVVFGNGAGACTDDPGLLYTAAGDYLSIDADGTPSGGGIRFGNGTEPTGDGTLNHYQINIRGTDCLNLQSVGYFGNTSLVQICGDEGIGAFPGALHISAPDSGVGLDTDGIVQTSSTNNGALFCSGTGCGIKVQAGGLSINTATGSVNILADAVTGIDTAQIPDNIGTFVGVGAANNFTGLNSFAGVTTHTADINMTSGSPGTGLRWPHTNPITDSTRIIQTDYFFDDKNGDGTKDVADHVIKLGCSNCNASGNHDVATFPSSNFAIEGTYDTVADGTANNWTNELNWDMETASTHALGTVGFRPFAAQTYQTLNPPVAVFIFKWKYNQESILKLETGGGVCVHCDTSTFSLDVRAYDADGDGTKESGGQLGLQGAGANMGYMAFWRSSDTAHYGILSADAVSATRFWYLPNLDGNVPIAQNLTTSGLAAWAVAGTSCATACTSIHAQGCLDSIIMTTGLPTGDCSSTAVRYLCECK